MNEQYPYSFSDVAKGAGRFEMQPTPRQGDMHYKSLVDLSKARSLGLFHARSIVACAATSRSKRLLGALDALGMRQGERWELRPPQTAKEEAAWSQILVSDQVLVFAGSSKEWIENLVLGLFSPFVAVFPSMSLTNDWLAFEKETFASRSDEVHVSLGAGRADVTFVGTGAAFATAIEVATQKPPLLWGYSKSGYRETVMSRPLIHAS